MKEIKNSINRSCRSYHTLVMYISYHINVCRSITITKLPFLIHTQNMVTIIYYINNTLVIGDLAFENLIEHEYYCIIKKRLDTVKKICNTKNYCSKTSIDNIPVLSFSTFYYNQSEMALNYEMLLYSSQNEKDYRDYYLCTNEIEINPNYIDTLKTITLSNKSNSTSLRIGSYSPTCGSDNNEYKPTINDFPFYIDNKTKYLIPDSQLTVNNHHRKQIDWDLKILNSSQKEKIKFASMSLFQCPDNKSKVEFIISYGFDKNLAKSHTEDQQIKVFIEYNVD